MVNINDIELRNYVLLLESVVEEEKKKNADLTKELEEVKNDLAHRDSFFSIMRDVLANDDIDNDFLATILYVVVHQEAWDYDLSKRELDIVDKFWNREYV